MFLSLPECKAQCNKFRCDRQPSELKIKRKGETKTVWCTYVDDECDGPWCMYGICVDHRMTSDGKCKGVKKAPVAFTGPEQIDDFDNEIDIIPDKYSKQMGGRRSL